MSFARLKKWVEKALGAEVFVSDFLKRKYRKILCWIGIGLIIWLFIPPIFGIYYFPEYNFAWFLSEPQGVGIIVLDQRRPMILCLNNWLYGTRPIHGLKTQPNGDIQFPKEPPVMEVVSFSVKNYFFS